MIDGPLMGIAATIGGDEFELGPDRCLLSDELVQKLIKSFRSSIQADQVNEQVQRIPGCGAL
jgi:hypothetical protein